jgi:hypothetical protein
MIIWSIGYRRFSFMLDSTLSLIELESIKLWCRRADLDEPGSRALRPRTKWVGTRHE